MEMKWHEKRLYDIEKQLNTSLENGISVREARARLDAEKKRAGGERYSLFVPPRTGMISTLLSFFKSPAALILPIIALLSFFLGALMQGFAIFLTATAGALISGMISVGAEKKQYDMLEYASPVIRVKRGGSILYTDGRNVTVGDIIFLSKGDLVPCDARIISSNRLEVSELIHTKGGIKNRKLKKHACDIEPSDGIKTPDALNMLYAGTAILDGDAIAVAVETAEDVYLAEYCKKSLISVSIFSKASEERIDRICRKILFFCTLAFAVLSVISILTFRESGYLPVFLMFLSSFSSISFELVKSAKRNIFANSLDRLSRKGKKDVDGVAYIRDFKAFETLSKITDLVLIGRAAFTYGTPRVDELFICGDRCDVSADDERSRHLMFCVYAYLCALEESKVRTDLVLDGVADSLFEYLKKTGFDQKGADLILHSLYFAPNELNTSGYACAETPEGAYRILLTFDRSDLSFCSHMRGENGLEAFDNSRTDILSGSEGNADRVDGKFLYVVTEADREMIFEGALSLVEDRVENADRMIDELGKMGIRTLPMIGDGSDDLTDLIGKFGEKTAYASDFENSDRDITYNFGEYTAYVGFSDQEYSRLIQHMRKNGASVAVYGIGDDHHEAMTQADIVISCDTLRYSSQKYKESVYEKLQVSGREGNLRCSSRTRFSAGMLIHRANKSGGGLVSINRAIRGAKSAETALSSSLLYYAMVMCVILPWAVVSALLGIMLLNGVLTAALSFSALILAVSAFADQRLRDDIKYPPVNGMLGSLVSREGAVSLIVRAAIVCFFAISIKLLDFFKIFGESASYSMPVFITIIIIAAIELLIFSRAFSNRGDGRYRTWLIFLGVYASLLALCGMITQDIFKEELFPNGIGTYEFLLIPIYCILYICAISVLHFILKKRNKR